MLVAGAGQTTVRIEGGLADAPAPSLEPWVRKQRPGLIEAPSATAGPACSASQPTCRARGPSDFHCVAHCVGDALGVGLNFAALAAFNHHPQQGLGT